MKEDIFSTDKYLSLVNEYWNAANYLTVAQLYLMRNALLEDKLTLADVKPRLVGHWGTCPGQNFVYAHCNRVINKYKLNMMLLSGPGHGGNFFVSNSYLEGAYSEVYPNVSQDKQGLDLLCKQFSFPKGISSHVAPETPGSINEGGELGYSLAHAFGAVLDNPSLIATVIVGDGEAETGPLATSWHGNKFINPKTDGAVLPILHLNGYKISNPTVLSRIDKKELESLMLGYGYKPYFVEGDDPKKMHKAMAKAMDVCIETIKNIQANARKSKTFTRAVWPMIVLRTPKGWTGPKVVDGKQVEGCFRAHQVPLVVNDEKTLSQLEDWLRSYHPEKLFVNYKLRKDIADILPRGKARISANPHTNGGVLLKPLKTPNVKDYEVKVTRPGKTMTQDMLELGGYIRDVFKLNSKNANYRIFSPDEAMSNRLYKVFETENRSFNLNILPNDEGLAHNGRIMDSYLSEHLCEGMLEGYILTGRHGMFDSYEAFIRVVDSMVGQHAKWLHTVNKLPWRADISSLNLILTSNVWQQDHNGYTHQDPGFLGALNDKTADVTRIYLPPDANTLIATFDKCTNSKNVINAIVASKHPSPQWLNMKQAVEHCDKGIGVWKFASLNDYNNPDVVIACCGSTPTMEAVACVSLIKEYLPKLNVRFVNVVDLMRMHSADRHPHGMTDEEYDEIFTKDKPIIFNFHGYPTLIRDITYARHNKNMYIGGYIENGAITTPYDMRVLNSIDRWHLLTEVVNRIKLPKAKKDSIIKAMQDKLAQHTEYIAETGIDLPEILNWQWK